MSLNESERRLLLAMARDFSAMCHLQGWDGSEAEIMKLVAAVEAENANRNGVVDTPPAQDSAIASAWAPVTDPDQTRHVWASALAADLAREIDEKAKQYAKSPARDTTGGAGGGDPLPHTFQGWQPIATAPHDVELLFWIVPKDAEETYHDGAGKPIMASFKPHQARCKYGRWSALTKALYWHVLPLDPPPPTTLTVFNSETARADQAEADLARLSLVHQQLRERIDVLLQEWRMTAKGAEALSSQRREEQRHGDASLWANRASVYATCMDELLAASTTETPP